MSETVATNTSARRFWWSYPIVQSVLMCDGCNNIAGFDDSGHEKSDDDDDDDKYDNDGDDCPRQIQSDNPQ